MTEVTGICWVVIYVLEIKKLGQAEDLNSRSHLESHKDGSKEHQLKRTPLPPFLHFRFEMRLASLNDELKSTEDHIHADLRSGTDEIHLREELVDHRLKAFGTNYRIIHRREEQGISEHSYGLVGKVPCSAVVSLLFHDARSDLR